MTFDVDSLLRARGTETAGRAFKPGNLTRSTGNVLGLTATAAPDLPTMWERLVLKIPLPYVLSCALLTLFVSFPGQALSRFLDTWDFGKTFPALPADLSFWQAVGILSLSAGLSFYLFYIIRYTRRAFRALGPEVTPLLVDGPQAFDRAVARMSFVKPALAVSLFFAVAVIPPTIQNVQSIGPVQLGWSIVQAGLTLWVDGLAVWVFVSALWGIHEMGKQELRLKPLSHDPFMGLGPLGCLSLSLYVFYFVGVGICLALFILEPPPIPTSVVLLVIGLAVVGTAMFFLPLNSIHMVMLGEKKRTMEAVRKRYWRAFETIETDVGKNPSLEDLQREVEDVKHTLAFDAAERRASQIPTWPS